MKLGKDLRVDDRVWMLEIGVDPDEPLAIERGEMDEWVYSAMVVWAHGENDKLRLVQGPSHKLPQRAYDTEEVAFAYTIVPEQPYAETRREAWELEVKDLRRWSLAYGAGADMIEGLLKEEWSSDG